MDEQTAANHEEVSHSRDKARKERVRWHWLISMRPGPNRPAHTITAQKVIWDLYPGGSDEPSGDGATKVQYRVIARQISRVCY